MSAKDLPTKATERSIGTICAGSRQLPDRVGLWMYSMVPLQRSHSPGELQSAGFQPPTLHEGHFSKARKPFEVHEGPRSTSKFLKQLNATCRINKIQQDAHK